MLVRGRRENEEFNGFPLVVGNFIDTLVVVASQALLHPGVDAEVRLVSELLKSAGVERSHRSTPEERHPYHGDALVFEAAAGELDFTGRRLFGSDRGNQAERFKHAYDFFFVHRSSKILCPQTLWRHGKAQSKARAKVGEASEGPAAPFESSFKFGNLEIVPERRNFGSVGAFSVRYTRWHGPCFRLSP